uniref:hypothetical protein n=1 Tax=Phocaeicola sp. TaxID=2773926 RepID=UPI00386EC3E6
TLQGSALFIMPDGTYTNIGKKTCGASEKSFTMKAVWLKEQENEQLIINESSIFGSTVLNITPQCAKCSLTTESDAILGKQFIYKSHLPQTFDKNEHEIVGKWTTSNNQQPLLKSYE